MDHVEAHSGRIIGSAPASTMKSAAARFLAGDVLYGRLRPYLNKVTIPAFDGLASAEFMVFPGSAFLSSDFLAYRLRSSDFVSFASHLNEGDRPRVDFAQIGVFVLDVPPLPEQRRIVEKIEELFSELDTAAQSLDLARAQLKTYRQSLLKSAFEGRLTADWRAANADKLETPEALLARIRKAREARYAQALKNWETALAHWRKGGEKGDRPSKPKRPEVISPETLDTDFLPRIADGWAISFLGDLDVEVFDGPFGSNLKSSDYVDAGVRVVRLENIGHGQFIEAKLSYISEEKYETIKRHTVVPGDIVFSSFVTDAIRSAIVPPSVPFAVNKADCFALRLHGSILDTRFVQFFLESRNAFKQLEGMIHGVGRPRINTTQLKELSVPICAQEVQLQVVEHLERVFSEIAAVEGDLDTRSAQIDALRHSILKKAFSGQLVPQDPADEPASALLARIKAQANAPTKRRKAKASA